MLAVSLLVCVCVGAEDAETNAYRVRTHRVVEPAPTGTADVVVLKFTAESVVQTGGVRAYEYRDVYFRVSPQGVTNRVELPSDLELGLPVKIVDMSDTPLPTNLLAEPIQPLELPPPPRPTPPELPPAPLPTHAFTYVDTAPLDGNPLPDMNAPLLSSELGVNDPIEAFNRSMYAVDGAIYVYFLRPVGKAYAYVVPLYARKGIKRMDHNIQLPKRLLNNLLQAEFTGAGIEVSRFLINTTVGLAGFYDPAKNWFDLTNDDEDTGQTLAVWGVGPGCFLYLPIIGPTTLRDGVGMIIDDQLDPRAWIPFGGSGIRFLMKFSNATMYFDTLDQKRLETMDLYTLRRDFWYLVREADIDK
jgi:phospholipid-binding lipoprotein MlaA